MAIAVSFPVIGVWGAPKLGLGILVGGLLLGAILDADYITKREEENKRKAEENHAKLMEKLEKCKK